jgi:hypothetical protein
MSWLFSQALVAASSVDICSDGEPCAQLNVMPTAQPFWRNDKTMEPSRLSRFGLTLRLLTERDGEDLLTSFLAGFPVRTSALPERAQGSTAPGRDSGSSSPGWFAKWSPEKSGWRTAQHSLVEDLESYSETWPRRGMTRNGYAYLLPNAEPPMNATASGFVPTPVATDCKSENMSLDLVARRQADSTRGVRLAEFLHRQALPTPNAGNSHWGGTLDEWGGSTNAFRQTEIGRLPLNPCWVEQLMGWSTDWTDLKPLETAKFQEWQQQHGACLEAEAA